MNKSITEIEKRSEHTPLMRQYPDMCGLNLVGTPFSTSFNAREKSIRLHVAYTKKRCFGLS